MKAYFSILLNFITSVEQLTVCSMRKFSSVFGQMNILPFGHFVMENPCKYTVF